MESIERLLIVLLEPLTKRSDSDDLIGILCYCGIITAALIVGFVLTWILRSRAMRRALWYKSPFWDRGGYGPMTGLAPVEAGIVLSVDISCLLAMCLLDMVAAGYLKILDDTPLKVEALTRQDASGFQCEILDAIGDDGSPDARKMLLALDKLYQKLESDIRGYSIKETVSHYLQLVDQLWDSMEEERTESGSLRALEENFAWLLLHENAPEELEARFRTSARWTTVKPIVRKLRVVKQRIVTNEELLEHAASHSEGIFLNKSYRDGILHWARTYLRRSGLAEARIVATSRYIDDEAEDVMDKHRTELSSKLDRMQQLIERIEHDSEQQ